MTTNNRKILKEIGYPDEMLETMTDEDCEAEVIEIQTGGH